MRRVLVILFLYALVSCHGKSSPHVPSDIIAPDSMVGILTEVHILQSKIQLGYYRNDTVLVLQDEFKDIWKRHHVTEEDYNKSIKYYSYHPALLDPIYEKVLNNLSEEKAELLGKPHN